jgi:TolA-binding protein
MVLRAGETLSVSLGDQEAASVGSAASSPAAATADSPAALAPAPSAGRHRETLAAGGERARPARDWRADLADGQASLVVADARRQGLSHVLEAADSEDLAALADAARYIGSEELARRALFSQRRRFPGSVRAAEASFLLGRLEDESAGGALRSLAWYDRYLEEAPAGAYVSEALGRKMMVLERAHRRAEAAAIASDYLRRFPAGSYAHAASVLVGASGPAAPPGSSHIR